MKWILISLLITHSVYAMDKQSGKEIELQDLWLNKGHYSHPAFRQREQQDFQTLCRQINVTITSIDLPLPRALFKPAPLMLAATFKNFETVQELLMLKARINTKNERGETALHCAAHGWPENPSQSRIVSLLLDNKADIDERDDAGNTPLFGPAHIVIAVLIGRGANINTQNNNGETPLIYAVKHCEDFARAKLLLELGADPSIKDNQGKTVFDVDRHQKTAHELLCFYSQEVHKAARTPKLLTQQDEAALESLAPEKIAEIVKVPTHTQGIPSLIADYICKLTLESEFQPAPQQPYEKLERKNEAAY